nr:Flavin mononucleotide phosphatase YbjI [Candidatus Pantoea persica]
MALSSAGPGVIHGLAGELGAIKPYHHGEVCGRLLFPFLDLLAESEQPAQQQLMQALQSAQFATPAPQPVRFLKDWLQQ